METCDHVKNYNAKEFLTSWNNEDYIGNGNFASVRRCYHPELDAVVVKAYSVTGNKDRKKKITEEFYDETKVLELIAHKNIVKVFGTAKWSKFLGIVMEYIDGGALQDFLLDKEIKSIPWELRLRFMLEITQALVYLHYGDKRVVYIHSDLKSQNILFTRDFTIKLADFGSANIVTATRVTRMPTTTGSKNRRHSSQHTVYYAAPEFLKNTNQKRTRAMDVYSSSMICYEVITRSEVFDGPNSSVITSLIMSQGQKPDKKLIKEVQDQLTDDVDQHIFKVLNDFMVKGWSFDPADRPDLRDVEKSLKEEFEAIDQAAFQEKIKPLKDYVGKTAVLYEESKRVELSKFQDDLEETESPPESPKLHSQDLNVAFNNGASIAVADPYNIPPAVPERDDDVKKIPSDENGLQPYVNDEVTLAELSNNFDEDEELEISSLTAPELYQTPEEELSDKQIEECSRYVTLFDYEAATEYEISLKKAEVVLILERNRGDYWKVYSIEQRKSGLVDARMLIPQAWYFGNSAVDKCERRLLNAHTFNGNFMITDLEEGGSKLRLSVMHSSKPFHYEIEFPRSDSTCRLCSDSGHFSSLVKLIENYQEVDEKLCCRLTTPCSRPRKVKYLYFEHDDIFLERKLRFGLVSEVWRGLLHETLPVLVKVAENTAVTREKLDIMQRIAYDNVVRFFGTTSAAPFYVTTEYTRRGNLLEHFSSESNVFDLCDGIEMGYQISNGMAYIERMNYIHGNLRASNILVGEKNICKIAGFGFYHLQNAAATFPNKWSSPETFETRHLTPKSDVWSFGILLTEIFTKGREPYPGMKVNQVIEELKTGYRMPKEQVELEGMPLPEDLYELLLECWEDDRTKRPTFHYIRGFLQDHPLMTSGFATYEAALEAETIKSPYSSRKGAKEHLQDYQTPHIPFPPPTGNQPKIPYKSSPMYIAILPHNANVKDELSVKKGDIFYFPEKPEDNWCKVFKRSGEKGFVPASCILPLKSFGGCMSEIECEKLLQENLMQPTFMIRYNDLDQGDLFQETSNTLFLSMLCSGCSCVHHYAITSTKFHTFYVDKQSKEFTDLINFADDYTFQPCSRSPIHDYATYYNCRLPVFEEGIYVEIPSHSQTISNETRPTATIAALSESRLSDIRPFFERKELYLYETMKLDRSELILQQKVEISPMATVQKGLLRESGEHILSYTIRRPEIEHGMLEKAFSQICHKNVAKYFGIVNFAGFFKIITEYLPHGNLQDFFKSSTGLETNFKEQLAIATQVAGGMAYLQANGIIHGDLRDVNVLVGKDKLCKVSGFCVADFYRDSECLYHFTKWTAPEVKANKRVTHKSDVWSYGVLLYVIFSKGKEPYSEPVIKSHKIHNKTKAGYRMKKPTTIPPLQDSIYDQMKLCWSEVDKERPDFMHIKDFFNGYLPCSS
ncbi:uncharacterized protein LOC143448919 isoform X3 [Clavelina lepadiformis]|uniref:uncharacterized protein LOC143448919 isoform X3 n=1 Tax=Clavelina lepadiformis TaxID=159417 RepID=UPI004042E1E7